MNRAGRLGAGRRLKVSGWTGGLLALLMVVGAAAPEAPVADAAMRQDGDAIRLLLEQGADVNQPQGDGMTALHWAARNNDSALAGTLIDAGASVDAGTRIGRYTPLHMASEVAAADVVSLLLGAGADPGVQTEGVGGATPLHFAAASGSAEAIALLAGAGADVDEPEQAWGQTPLMFAASRGRLDAVGALLRAGADVSVNTRVSDIAARAVADRVARQERNQRMQAGSAYEGGAPPAALPSPTPQQPVSAESQRARAEAASLKEAETRQIEEPEPLSYGELVGGQGGLTALLHAAREGHADVALALVDGGADVNQVSVGDQTSPLLMAMINGHYDLGVALLERGADPNLASHAGATPLFAALNTHWAPKARYPQQHVYMQQQRTYLDVMKTLLDAGADVNTRLTKHLWFMSFNFDLLQIDARGATPFWRAAYALDIPAMQLLVSHGADPNMPTAKVPARRFRRSADTTDYSGLPPVPVGGPAVFPVHAASGVGYGEGFAGNAHRHVPDGWLPAVQYLVEELGADVNARDQNGFNAVHHAAARGDNELINYLVSLGADVTAVSRKGQTTVDMANGPVQRIQPFPETVALLESLGAKNNHRCVSC
ncbi:MAG: ankyrin repeat domain-containing protein [Longimicrobiales bacterium]